MTQEKITILVTAAGGGGVGEQILKSLLLTNEIHNKYYIVYCVNKINIK